MALHRIIWQLDSSSVPGQVAGDALLCRMPCVGGNGAIERLAFEEFASASRDELANRTKDLLQNEEAWRAGVHRAEANADAQLSFQVIGEKLKTL